MHSVGRLVRSPLSWPTDLVMTLAFGFRSDFERQDAER